MFCHILNGYPFNSERFSPDGEIPVVRIRDILNNRSETYYTGTEEIDFAIDNNDVLVGMDGDFNVAWWQGGKALLNQRVCCIRAPSLNLLKLIYYALPNPLKIINDLTFSTTVKHLSSGDVAKIHMAFPPPCEQSLIVNFLDKKTTLIDAAIQHKEQQIDLLKERKQILIQQAVTRGLNPDAPVLDSGIEWIGEIPAHWQSRRFKYLFSQSQLPVRPGDGVVTSYRDGQVTLRSNRRLSGYTEAILEGGYQGVRKGQLVLNSMDAFEGAIGVSESDGKCTPEYVVCDALSDDYMPEYFAYLLREMALARYIQVICNAVRQRAVRIRFNNLASRFMVVPPIEEQRAIVARIKAETEKQEAAVALLEQQITKLKEYKATLINSAVTGKIKVPGVVEPATQDMEVA